MKGKKWFLSFLFGLTGVLSMAVFLVAYLDPCFHFHKPLKGYCYTLVWADERMKNDGITKHFEYDAIITGSSMTENFKTSEFDRLFSTHSIKVSYSGATYKEINDNLKAAFNTENNIKYIVRSLDYYGLLREKDSMREDMGEYPVYLYNKNFFDDVRYLLNMDIILGECIPMVIGKINGRPGGITSFDVYCNWMEDARFGKEGVLKGRKEFLEPKIMQKLSETEKKIIKDNLEQNIIALAKSETETIFYCFFPPYSLVFWGEQYENGNVEKYLDAEAIALEMLLPFDNIKVFSFNHVDGLNTNIGNYRDSEHYGEWINSFILQCMKEDKYIITEDNYQEYLIKERNLFLNFDYNSLIERNID